MKKVMKLTLGLSALIVAASARGEDVDATKKAPVMTPIENMYGKVEVRQTSLQWSQGAAGGGQKVDNYSLMPILGTKTYNGKLDTYIVTPFSTAARTSNFGQRQSEWLVYFTAFENNNFTITPYTDSYLAWTDPNTQVQQPFTTCGAVTFDAKTVLTSSAGDLTLHAAIEPEVLTGTRALQTSLINKDPNQTYTLSNGQGNNTQIAQSEPNWDMEYVAGVAYVPSFAAKLKLVTDVYFDRTYKPTYDLVPADGTDHYQKAGYAYQDLTRTDIILSYKADAMTTFQNRTIVSHDGLYNRNQRIENRLSIIQKLF